MKSYDILVIAGTAEAREVIEERLAEGNTILASVATDLGAAMLTPYDVDVRIGRLDVDGFVEIIRDNQIKEVFDASHPFAQIVSKTVKEACRITGIPYSCYERDDPGYDYDRIRYVKDVEEAIECLNETEGHILLTTGVNTAGAYFAGVRGAKERLYIRVLDIESSYAGCRDAGYPDSHVYGEMPPFSLADNLRLIRETDARVLVSKDSGKTGGVDIKAEACREAGIPMILIKRPEE